MAHIKIDRKKLIHFFLAGLLTILSAGGCSRPFSDSIPTGWKHPGASRCNQAARSVSTSISPGVKCRLRGSLWYGNRQVSFTTVDILARFLHIGGHDLVEPLMVIKVHRIFTLLAPIIMTIQSPA